MKLDLSQPVRRVLTTNNMHWGKATAAGQHPSTVAHDHQQLPGTSNRYTLWGKGRMVIGCQRWSLSNMSCGNILMNLLWMPWILKGWVFLVKHVPWEFGSVREVGQVITVTAQLFCEILLWWYCCHFRLVETKLYLSALNDLEWYCTESTSAMQHHTASYCINPMIVSILCTSSVWALCQNLFAWILAAFSNWGWGWGVWVVMCEKLGDMLQFEDYNFWMPFSSGIACVSL